MAKNFQDITDLRSILNNMGLIFGGRLTILEGRGATFIIKAMMLVIIIPRRIDPLIFFVNKAAIIINPKTEMKTGCELILPT
jgi:hypothetical protein